MIDDEEEILDQAYGYATGAVKEFLESVIEDFRQYQLTGEQLVAVSTLYKLVTSPSEEYDGMLSFGIKYRLGGGSFKIQEMKFDSDGLQLGYEGWEQDEFGGDSFSETVLPFDDVEQALDSMTTIDNFLGEFEQGLLEIQNERVIESITM